MLVGSIVCITLIKKNLEHIKKSHTNFNLPNFVIDNISTLTLKLVKSTIEGTINVGNTAKNVYITLDKDSKITLTGDSYCNTLIDFRFQPKLIAEDGKAGSGQKSSGKSGKDLEDFAGLLKVSKASAGENIITEGSTGADMYFLIDGSGVFIPGSCHARVPVIAGLISSI